MSKSAFSTTRTRRQAPRGCLIAFGLAFAGMGMLFLVVAFSIVVLPSLKTRSFEPTRCRILTAEIESNSGSDGTTYLAKFTYEYEVDGQRYVGDRYRAVLTSGPRRMAEQQIADYPVGSEQTCFYDPQDPASAVLDKAFGWVTWLLVLIPVPFIIGGLLLAVFSAWRAGERHPGPAGATWTGLSPAAGSHSVAAVTASDRATSSSALRGELPDSRHPEDLLDRDWNQPMKLKPAQPRIKTAVGLLLVSLFWNGIVGTFLYFLIFDPPGGWIRIIIGVFLIPFVLIGLFLIGATIRSFLQIFNPSVEIALGRGTIPLGGSVDLAWEVHGRLSVIRKLEIWLIGEASATFRQGTSTYTDQDIFAKIPVTTATTHQDISFGSATLTIPADTMHTADLGNNEITWRVEVNGDIPWWPDIEEKFAFRVSPL